MSTAEKSIEHVNKDPRVFEQFEDLDQQNESYIVGMWAFLVTEVMFFGGAFIAYILYRWKYQPEFYQIHKLLDVKLGAINTIVLLTSSLSMALAVRSVQIKNRTAALGFLGFTILCAFGFLGIKYLEYSHKIYVGLLPGANFQWNEISATPEALKLVSPGTAQLFFSLYFAMTGLHGIHILLGILIIGALMVLIWKRHPLVEDYIPTELIGLYWHFVDLVWIFLFPLYYLLPSRKRRIIMTNHSSHEHHILPVSTYVKTYLALLVLMALTVGVAFLPYKIPALHEMSLLNNLVAMGIAVIKALLVIMIFMGVRFGTVLTRIFATLGFVWFVLMTLILVDYHYRESGSTKGWESVPGDALPRVKRQPGT